MNKIYQEVLLGDILEQRQETPNEQAIFNGEIPIISKISFLDGKIEYRTDRESKTQLILIKPGDFVLSGINAAKGAIAIHDEKNLFLLAATIHYTSYIPKKDRVDIRYLWWLLRSQSFRDLLNMYLPGGVKTELRAKYFLPIPIPLPPLEEQRRIVARIEELAAKIEEARGLRREAVKEVQALKASYMNNLFNPSKNQTNFYFRLEEIANIRAGVTLGRAIQGPTISVPYLRVANVQDGSLDLSVIKEIEILPEELEKWKLEEGDILLTEGGDWDKLGRGTIWKGEIPNCIHQNHIFRLRITQKDFDANFLAAYISSPYGKAYFQSAAKKTTNLASINQTQLKAMKVVKPSLDVQKEIVTLLDILQTKIDFLSRQQATSSAELDALLPSILDKAFKGEL